MLIEIGTLELNSMTPDGDGNLWLVTEMSGWDSPPQRITTLDIPTLHGQVTAENLYSARIITVKGICKSSNATDMYEAQYNLTNLTDVLDRFSPLEFAVTEDIRRHCNVVRADGPRMRIAGKAWFEFQVTFRADDPYKYDASDNPYI